MKNLISSVFAFIAILALNTASAQNPHFIGDPQIQDLGNKLQFCAKIAGLGNSQLVTIRLEATATITTTCTNPGGNIAPGQTKVEAISAQGQFQSDKNGSVTFCLQTAEPTPGSCPNGKWTPAVSDVSFSNARVTVNGQVVR